MILMAYSVFDAKAEAYGRPFFFATRGLAVRWFQDAVENVPRHDSDFTAMMHQHPEDFALMEIGAFDDVSGRLTSVEVPFRVLSGHECPNLKKKEN